MSGLSSWLDSFTGGPLGVIAPLVEILILSVLVYIVINFMRGTRGAGVARGLTVIYGTGFVLLLFAVKYLHLENIRWILENLVAVSVIGVLVIFQPEFRRGLIRLGEGVALRFMSHRGTSVVKEVADAALAISRRNEVGALIVLERETKIGSYIESGVELDAAVNASLIRTIFTKNTPLHDGAVIIRQGRIAAANCLLPLSENVEACRGMGTRHRAAIGLTEESDAVVVVVSEETSVISVAVEGRMLRELDYESLRAFLREHCAQVEESGGLSNGGEA